MKKRFLLAVSACIVFSILLFNCTLNRTAIIIMSGIRIYRAMFLSFAMFAFISFTVLIFTIILYSKNKKVKQKTGMFDNPGMTEADRCRLYDDLHKFGEDKWKDIFNLKDLADSEQKLSAVINMRRKVINEWQKIKILKECTNLLPA